MRFLLVILLALFSLTATSHAYTHPGICLTRPDLDLIKANLNVEPWKSAYTALAADSKSDPNYLIQGPFATVSRTPNINLGQWQGDMQAVYNLSRMWYFTGENAYAQKAHDILLAWAGTHTLFDGAEMYLSMGDFAYRTFTGADILRGTWPGWTQADTDTCKAYFNAVWWHGNGIDITQPLRSANQGIIQLVAVIGVAVFNDDELKFAQCLQSFRADITGGLPDSLPNGELGDSGRDQGHPYGELLHLAQIAEIFWEQGVDVYADKENRLLAAGEFFSRYNLFVNTPYIPFGTKYDYYPTHGGGPGFYPSPDALNLIYNAYVTRKGLAAPYIKQFRDARGENGDSFVYRTDGDISTAQTPPPLPATAPSAAVTTGFLNTDIGGATPAGSGTYSNGTWTVTGAGTDITGNSDSYHFTYKQLTGDFTFIAKVTSLQAADPYAKAAIVMRDTLAADAPRRIYFGYEPGTAGSIPNRVASHQRGFTANSHNDADEFTHDGVPLPQWLKLQRLGTRMLVFHSDDGANWIPLQNAEYAGWSGTAYVGLGVCSRKNGTLATATFTDVQLTGGDGGEAAKSPATPRYVYAAPGSRQVPLRWLEAAYATSYKVQRAATSGGPYTTVATVSGTSWTDFDVTPGSNWVYVVSALNAVGESGLSPEETVTTQSLPGYGKLSGTVIGTTGSYANNPATTRAAAVDEDFTTGFDAPAATGSWVGLDFGSQKVLTELSYVPRNGQQGRMVGGIFQASNTANFSSGVVTLYTVPTAPPYNVYTRQPISDPAGYRYVRYYGPPDGLCNVAEIAFNGYASGTTAAVPPAPGNLLATSLSFSEIELSWTAAPTSTPGYYIVRRATSSGGPYTIIATDLTRPFYRDSGLQLGMKYYYVVSFVSVGGESISSNEVTPPPAPPSGLAAAANSNQVTLTWVPATGALSYNVKRSTVSGGPYTIVGSASGTSYTDFTTSNGTTYYYVVASAIPGGQSINSSEVSATPAAQNVWWDATTAAGLGNGSGAWNAGNTPLWSASSAGVSNPLLPWFQGNHAWFQTGGTLTATIAAGDRVQVSSLHQAAAGTATTMSGGTLQIDTDAGLGNGESGNDKALTINSAVVLNSSNIAVACGTTGGAITFGGVISEMGGSRALTKTGPGGLSFKGTNTFTGGLTITGGQVANGVNSNTTLFGLGPITLASTTAITGGNRTIYVANTNFAFDNNFIIQTGTQNRLEFSRAATLPLNGSITGGGLFQISTGFNPVIQFNGNLTNFTGTLQLVGNGGTGGATSYYDLTNTTTIGAPNATIRLESAVDSTNAANLLLLRWNPATTTSATIPLGSLTGSFGSAQTSANIVVQNAKAGTTATWKIGGLGAAGTSSTFAGIVQNGLGTSSLEKSGAGALILTAAQTYTGTTTVSSGQLIINGSLAAGSAVSVNANATLGGTGTISGPAAVSANARLAPGQTVPGTLNFASGLTFSAGSVLDLDLGSTSDKIALSGSYTAPASGTVTINLNPASGFGAGTFTLITGANGISADRFALGAAPSGYRYALTAGNGTLTLTTTALTALENWRQAHFGTIENTGTASDNADPDGDGWTNLDEYTAGTDPLDAGSVLRISQITASGNDMLISFATVTGKTYRLERSDTLAAGSWIIVQQNIPGTGSAVQISDPGAANNARRFYRLSVF